MKNKIVYIMVLLLLTSCFRSYGTSKINRPEEEIEKIVIGSDKQTVYDMYKDGFLGEYNVNGKNFYEFQYMKVGYNWLGIIPIAGLYAKQNQVTEKHLVVYFDKDGKVETYKIISVDK